MDEKKVRVGLAGYGTVGCGVAKIILEQADSIAAKTGIRLELGCVVDLDTESKRPVELPKGLLCDDINCILNDDTIGIGVELIGGTGAAKDLQLAMLKAGKDVVTANKALLAEYGEELFGCARENGRCIAFEASCAGGIPIVSAIRSGLTANRIESMYGIVNGTCNYILSNMTSKGIGFEEALLGAQQLGYAEADPTLDINGGDSAHKLAILASLALGCQIHLDDIYVEGIEGISRDDIHYGGEMGYCLKLLAICDHTEDGKVSLRVHPSFISKDDSLANVNGAFNAVSIFGNAVGELTFYGRGAGMMATASAVVADIIDVAIGNSRAAFESLNMRSHEEIKDDIVGIGESVSRFYVRLMVKDQPGVFSQIATILSENSISISGILQHEGEGPDNTVPVVMTTHPTRQSKVSAAIESLDGLDTVCSEPVCIRIVDIPEDKD